MISCCKRMNYRILNCFQWSHVRIIDLNFRKVFYSSSKLSMLSSRAHKKRHSFSLFYITTFKSKQAYEVWQRYWLHKGQCTSFVSKYFTRPIFCKIFVLIFQQSCLPWQMGYTCNFVVQWHFGFQNIALHVESNKLRAVLLLFIKQQKSECQMAYMMGVQLTSLLLRTFFRSGRSPTY